MGSMNRLAIEGNLTIYNALEQKERLSTALEVADGLELDLSQVGEIDTAGLQLLILAKREAVRLNKRLSIVAHSQAVHQVFDFCNLVGYFGDPIVITLREQQ